MCTNYKYFIVVGLVCSYTASRYDESQIGNLVLNTLFTKELLQKSLLVTDLFILKINLMAHSKNGRHLMQ